MVRSGILVVRTLWCRKTSTGYVKHQRSSSSIRAFFTLVASPLEYSPSHDSWQQSPRQRTSFLGTTVRISRRTTSAMRKCPPQTIDGMRRGVIIPRSAAQSYESTLIGSCRRRRSRHHEETVGYFLNGHENPEQSSGEHSVIHPLCKYVKESVDHLRLHNNERRGREMEDGERVRG